MTAPVSRTNRSRVTNGAPFPRGVDGRSATARRYKDLLAAYTAALPQPPTAATGALLRSLTATSLALEQIAATAAQGLPTDSDLLVRLTNSQGRLLASLGLAAWGREEPPEPQKPDPLAAHRRRMGWDPR